MKTFEEYLKDTGEVGFVDTVLGPIVYAHGLPHAHPKERVVFETGEMGYIMSFNRDQVEIALLSPTDVKVGTRISRTNESLKIAVSTKMLGSVISSKEMESTIYEAADKDAEYREIDTSESLFSDHTKVTHPLDTEVTIVDMLVPLAKGQREIIVGDRKTGKSSFLHQVVLSASKQGMVCIYACIGKTEQEIQRVSTYFKNNPLSKDVIIVASNSSHRPGVTFLAPYIGMTIAEFFKDQGKDVMLILDDLTTHARYYREMMLLAKRFPGRGSYPGDIFYIHSRLLERAGSYSKGTITCLPVAQSVQGDLSGYIQTNLMSITDGHIFFDNELFDQGRRPAINPFLSVTRVGNQTQTNLQREVGRQLRGFLSHYEKIKAFRHFQSELSESVQANFDMGERMTIYLDQTIDVLIPRTVNVLLFGCIWSNFWKNIPIAKMKQDFIEIRKAYEGKADFKKLIDEMIAGSDTLEIFLQNLKQNQMKIFEQTRSVPEASLAGLAHSVTDNPSANPAAPASPVSSPETVGPANENKT